MAYTMDKRLEEGMKLLKEGKQIDKALKLINASARKGTTQGKSYFEVGRIIREGAPGLEPNVEDSRKYYDAAVNHFLRESCDSMDYRELGDYFYYGLGTEPIDIEKASDYYALASKGGDSEAQHRLDEIQASLNKDKVEELPVEDSNEPNTEIINSPAKAPEPTQVKIAPVVAATNAPATPEQQEVMDAVQRDALLLKAIRMIDNPSSTMQERIDGIELVKVACDDGSMRAAILLGYLYEGTNAIVERDLEGSKRYYELAISRGSVSAEFRLGKLYLLREAKFRDEEKGHQLIIDSARQGYAYALNYLGDCFREKVLDSRNLDLAYHYYSLAGSKGLGLAYHNMADIDASRQQLDLAKQHEAYAVKNGYDVRLGIQDPLYYTLHL
jgi:TPR repeat protein